MKISVSWLEPIVLHDASHQNLIYSCRDLSVLPDRTGVYVFARRFGETVTPLYVGQAMSLRSRICQQFNNLRLMKSVENAAIGQRVILVAPIAIRRGQKPEIVLDIVEQALIEHFMAQGYELLNRLGTRIPKHSIGFGGESVSAQSRPTRHERSEAVAPPNLKLKLLRPGFGPGLKPLGRSQELRRHAGCKSPIASSRVPGGTRRAAWLRRVGPGRTA